MKKRWLSLILTFAIMIPFVPVIAHAEIIDSGTCGAQGDNLTWTFDSEGTLTISGKGAMADYGEHSNLSPMRLNFSAKKLVVKDGVTSIGAYALQECPNLIEISMPNSVTSIGRGAFRCCGEYKSIEEFNISKYVTDIGSYAFMGAAIKSFNVDPENPSYKSVDGVVIDTRYDELLYYPIANEATEYRVPDEVKTIGRDAFYRARNLTSVDINSVERIQGYAFIDCSGLTEFTVPACVKYIDYGAFGRNNSISKITVLNKTLVYRDRDIFIFGGCAPDLTMYGYSGSTSEEYAAEHVIPFVPIDENVVSVTGTVSNENGLAIADAAVSLTNENGVAIASTTTDQSGFYSFPKVASGTYIIRAADGMGGAVTDELVVLPTNGDITADLTIRQGASLSGLVVYEDSAPAASAKLIITNDAGDRIAVLYTDEDGSYAFSGIPLGSYNITASSEIDDRKYTGAAAVTIEDAADIAVGDIILKAENVGAGTANIRGKVTARGSTQPSVVILKDVFMNEVAKYTTGKNGKYSFVNIPDGAYTIIATTESDGAGYTTVTIKDGKIIAGKTDITVYKSGTVEDIETRIDLLPAPNSAADIITDALSDIENVKNMYDSLSDKDKRQVNKDSLDKLNKLIVAAANPTMSISTENAGGFTATVQGLETVVSGDEILERKSSDISLDIAIYTPPEEGEDDPEALYDVEQINKKAADEEKTIIGCFDISLTKSADGEEKKISDIKKDSTGTGKVKITLGLPEEYKDHKNYYMLHVHNGHLSTLSDIDNDPDTVTFETDKFSKFAMIYDDIERTDPSIMEEPEAAVIEAIGKYAGKLRVVSDAVDDNAVFTVIAERGESLPALSLFAAEYDASGRLAKVSIGENGDIVDDMITITVPISNTDNYKFMLWDEYNTPVIDAFSPENTVKSPIKIMPLGDSITNGFSVAGAYRNRLCELLVQNNLSESVDFVGSQSTGTGYDKDNEGHSGWAIAAVPVSGDVEKKGRQGLTENIDSWMDTYEPDIVLLQIGTNDILSLYDLDNVPMRLEALVDKILAKLPQRGKLYIAKIPYIAENATYNKTGKNQTEMSEIVDTYNAAVTNLAEEKGLTLVDINGALTLFDLKDGIHPTVDGYAKMGDLWYEVLESEIRGRL